MDRQIVLKKIKTKWQELSTREQFYLGGVVVFIVIIILYYALFAPLSNHVYRLQQQVGYQQTLLDWMRPRVAVLHNTATTSEPIQIVSENELLPTIDLRLKQSLFAAAVDEISQTTNNEVRITFKQVPFDELMAWLATQWRTSRIGVSDIDVQKGEKVGMAKVALTLTVKT